MRIALAAALWLMFVSASSAQYPGNGAANPYSPPDPPQKRSPFPFSGDPGAPKPGDNQGKFRGNLNANPYDPNNVNPYGPGPQYRPANP